MSQHAPTEAPLVVAVSHPARTADPAHTAPTGHEDVRSAVAVARVAVPVPVDRPFDYVVGPAFELEVGVGSRVSVPFGPRRLTGVVVALDTVAADRAAGLKSIADVLDIDGPSVPEPLVDLAQWVADHYVCGWGEALRAMLPPEGRVGVKTERRLRLAPAAADGAPPQPTGVRQQAVLRVLSELRSSGTHDASASEVMRRSGASSATVRRLIDLGFVAEAQQEVERRYLPELGREGPKQHELHPAQRNALEQITEGVDAGTYRSYLLHGVTGSGKTEVYIAALRRTLEAGRTGIVLVPEIALTPQTVSRFRAHFGSRIAVLHSRMAPGERFDAWRGARRGAYDVVIGPRSAVFAPLENVGLIVVDEEHESSYKQYDPAPRYHARDVAVMRAYRAGAVCVLGSATPSMESYENARAGKYTLLQMLDRVPMSGGTPASLPDVRVVDLGQERQKGRLSGSFSDVLRYAVGERLRKKEQVILLQNRRGYAPVVECDECGWSPMCPDCSVTLTFHKATGALRCHYCGHRAPPARACEACGSIDVMELGQGTQRVEEELKSLFPEARLLRMDIDTTGTKDAHHHLLGRFGRGEADVLLGTQMVAKGLDFERVTLVGVVNADTGLLLPDFRAEERTFQLLTQVAGRAGRADRPGEVIFQTRNADNPAVVFAVQHDFEGFAAYALEMRRELRYPPFGRLAVVEFRGPDEEPVRAFAASWTAHLRSLQAPEGVRVLGPQAALIARVKRSYRYQTLVKAPPGDAAGLSDWLRRALGSGPRAKKEQHVSVDVDAMGIF